MNTALAIYTIFNVSFIHYFALPKRRINRIPVKCSGAIPDFSSADNQKKRASYVYGRNSTIMSLHRPAAVVDHGGRCSQGLMGSRCRHGSAIDLRRWQMVEEGVLHDGPLFYG